MPKDLTPHQLGIVRRAHEHRETIVAQRLAELASDLFVAPDEKTARRLWRSAAAALARTAADPARVARVLADRDVRALAALAAEVSSGRLPHR